MNKKGSLANHYSKAQWRSRATTLFIVRSLEIGGAEKQMAILAEYLTKEMYPCHVFSLECHGPLMGRLTELRVPVYCGGLKEGDLSVAPWKALFAEWKLIRVVRQLRPKVVHSFLPLITFMGALAGRINRVPRVIASCRALGTHQERYPILKTLDQVAYRLSHYVTVNSQAVWDDLMSRDRMDLGKLVLIYNGIDVGPFELACQKRDELRKKLGLRDCDRVVTAIANLISYKGHKDLLYAARLVKNRIPSCTFWLVGEDRGIQANLEHAARDLGIQKDVVFMGERSDIPNVLAVTDLSVLPSHEEGFSNVILESMAAGLPVVATSVGGNSEAVMDGVTGWLVPPRNPEIMAERIVDLLRDPQKARFWGAQGRERVKTLFTIEQMVSNYLRLYEIRYFERGR